jgi:hypothetical protein
MRSKTDGAVNTCQPKAATTTAAATYSLEALGHLADLVERHGAPGVVARGLRLPERLKIAVLRWVGHGVPL